MKYVLLAESEGTPERKETDRHHKDEGQVEDDYEVDQDEAEENEGI